VATLKLAADWPQQARERFEQGLSDMSLSLSTPAIDSIMAYLTALVKWNQAFNLTAIRDPLAMVDKHLLDSLSMQPHIGTGSLIDIGTGAGLPGVILAIVNPELSVTVLDSSSKKTRFITQFNATQGLQNLSIVTARCEQHEGQYTQVCSRAFASLQDMVAGTEHLLAVDGRWLAMKGHLPHDEIAALPSTIRLENAPALRVPFAAEARHLICLTRAPSLV
jgi:16S rRNA (guanine527-N7)-methyltransferase